jgi:hypothetical protein
MQTWPYARSPRRHRRVAWLRAHPDLWRHAPSDQEDVDDTNRPALIAVVHAMSRDGLFSATTSVNLQERLWSVRTLIADARRAETRTGRK